MNKSLGLFEFALGGESWGIQIVNILRVADKLLRVAMAIETEAHAVRLGVINCSHLIHFAVTFDAADAAIYVHGMVEIDVIRRLMDLNLRHRIT